MTRDEAKMLKVGDRVTVKGLYGGSDRDVVIKEVFPKQISKPHPSNSGAPDEEDYPLFRTTYYAGAISWGWFK